MSLLGRGGARGGGAHCSGRDVNKPVLETKTDLTLTVHLYTSVIIL